MPYKEITLTLRHSIHVSPTQMSRPHCVCVCVRARCLSHVYHTYNTLQYSAIVPTVLEHARHQFALQRRERSTEIERPKEPKSECLEGPVGVEFHSISTNCGPRGSAVSSSVGFTEQPPAIWQFRTFMRLESGSWCRFC